VNTDVAGEDRQHGDGAGGQLAVGLSLRAPALADIRGFGGTDLPGQLDDAVGRNTGDSRSPFRRFGGGVLAVAQNVRLVMTVGRSAFRQGGFIVPDAVFVEERLVDKVFVNQGSAWKTENILR